MSKKRVWGMKDINIGILGFGTVGAGVVEGILKNGELMAQRTGIRPVVAKFRCCARLKTAWLAIRLKACTEF